MGAGGGTVGARSGFAHGFKSIGGAEKLAGLDASNFSASGEGDGDGGGGDLAGEFGNGENVIGTQGEVGGMDFSAEGFDGSADGLETILRILENAGPCSVGVTNLMAVVGHRCWFFPGEGRVRGKTIMSMREWGRIVK